jgi:hypothetical protein
MPRLGVLLLLLSTAVMTAQAASCPSVPVVRYEPRSFLGYACEDDCERHKDGFAWAQRHRVSDPAACRSLPRAEAQGCRAFTDSSVTPDEAGYRWALENEITVSCLCGGGGAGFRAGCLRYVAETGSWPLRAR